MLVYLVKYINFNLILDMLMIAKQDILISLKTKD